MAKKRKMKHTNLPQGSQYMIHTNSDA